MHPPVDADPDDDGSDLLPEQPFSCYCGTRLTIPMAPGIRKQCLCGAVHEYTPLGVRNLGMRAWLGDALWDDEWSVNS